jgi:hypothetical protein
MNAWDDIERDELRAEDRMERMRWRPHWCPTCRGHDGPGSPCEPVTEDEDEQLTEPGE